jgi:hypothetical protein
MRPAARLDARRGRRPTRCEYSGALTLAWSWSAAEGALGRAYLHQLAIDFFETTLVIVFDELATHACAARPT